MSTSTIVDTSGIKIPGDLAGLLVPASELAPNPWNPNHMEGFMRSKLIGAIRADGFVLPILVRPEKREAKIAEGIKWEIVDGEHRWRVAAEELGMENVPVLNLGDITDSEAQQITIKANSLKGEFDSVQLAEIVKNLTDNLGKEAVVEALPYTPERIQGMLDLLNTSTDSLAGLLADPGAAAPPPAGSMSSPATAGSMRDEFKSFDGSTMAFECKCPRCGFEFNPEKK